jgi:hypothetical protein
MTSDKVPAAERRASGTAKTNARRDRAFIAVLLLGAAGLVVADRLLPWPVGNAFLLFLGLGLAIWSGAARHVGPLIPGALLIGFGTAVLLLAIDPKWVED